MAGFEQRAKRYPTDLVNEEWRFIAPLLPNDFPLWQTDYWWFRRFVRRLLFKTIHDVALMLDRERESREATVKATTPVPGALRTTRPLEVVQLDHTRARLFIVDEETRLPIGRPWLTLAIDVHSRMVMGFHLTMDAPSRLSTSLCLLHAVFDKTAWLQEREIAEPWPIAGLPDALHVDNGADFRSKAFKRGCDDAGVAVICRPPGQPRFGGNIERLIGTQMGRLHLLPGTTFGDVDERGDYDSRRHAALTLRELASPSASAHAVVQDRQRPSMRLHRRDAVHTLGYRA